MTRRKALQILLVVSVWAAFKRRGFAAQFSSIKDIEALQKNWKALLADGIKVPLPSESLKVSKDEWRKRLDPMQFAILREEGTEYAGSSPLNAEKREGVYACAGCDLPLFTSQMKFESGTGWPSFFTTIPGVFDSKTDHLLIYARTEYHCTRCGGHHGHIFEDGPKPTGLRYCNNGVALKFIPKHGQA